MSLGPAIKPKPAEEKPEVWTRLKRNPRVEVSSKTGLWRTAEPPPDPELDAYLERHRDPLNPKETP